MREKSLGGSEDLDLPAGEADQRLQRLAHRDIVIHDEHDWRRVRHGGRPHYAINSPALAPGGAGCLPMVFRNARGGHRSEPQTVCIPRRAVLLNNPRRPSIMLWY